MQTLILVHCSSGPSLRKQILADLQSREISSRYRLKVAKQQKPGRNPGWSSFEPSDPTVPGALKVEWDSDTATLLCRLVTKDPKKLPDELAGLWLRYLFAEHGNRIHTVLIIPRCSNGLTNHVDQA